MQKTYLSCLCSYINSRQRKEFYNIFRRLIPLFTLRTPFRATIFKMFEYAVSTSCMLHLFICGLFNNRVAQAVQCLATDWTTGRSSSIPGGDERIFPLASVSRPTLGPTQPCVQWVPEVLSPVVKRGRGVTLISHPHLVPRSRMSRGYTSSTPTRLDNVDDITSHSKTIFLIEQLRCPKTRRQGAFSFSIVVMISC
jgi:hypothetical protein